MFLVQWFNDVSAQTWAAVFIFLGVAMKIWHPESDAGTLLIGGGLTHLRNDLPPAIPSSKIAEVKIEEKAKP